MTLDELGDALRGAPVIVVFALCFVVLIGVSLSREGRDLTNTPARAGARRVATAVAVWTLVLLTAAVCAVRLASLLT